MHSVISGLGISKLLSTFKERIKLDGALREAQIRFTSRKNDEKVYTTSKGFDIETFKKRSAPFAQEASSPYRTLYPCKQFTPQHDLSRAAQKALEKRRPVMTVSKIQETVINPRFSVGRDGNLRAVRWPPLYKFKGDVESPQKRDQSIDKHSRIMFKPLYSSKKPYDPGAIAFLRNTLKPSFSRKSIPSRTFMNSQSYKSEFQIQANRAQHSVASHQTRSEVEMLKWKINQMNSAKGILPFRHSYSNLAAAKKKIERSQAEEDHLTCLEELVGSVRAIQREVNLLKMVPSVQGKINLKNNHGQPNKGVESNESRDHSVTVELAKEKAKEGPRDDLSSFKEALLAKIEKNRFAETDLRCKCRKITVQGENDGLSEGTHSGVPPKEVISFPRENRSLLVFNSESKSRRNFSSMIDTVEFEQKRASNPSEKGFLQTVKSFIFPLQSEPPMRKLKQKDSIKDDTAELKDTVSLTEAQQVAENKMNSDDKTSFETDNLASLNAKVEKAELSSNDVMLARIKKFRLGCEELTCSCALCERKLVNNDEITKMPVERTALLTKAEGDDAVPVKIALRSSPPVTSAVIRSIENFKLPLKAQIAEFRKNRGMNQQNHGPHSNLKIRTIPNRQDERKLLASHSLVVTKKHCLHSDSRAMDNVKSKTSQVDAYRPLYSSKGSIRPGKQEVKLHEIPSQRNPVNQGFTGARKTDVNRLKNLIVKTTRSDPSFHPCTKLFDDFPGLQEANCRSVTTSNQWTQCTPTEENSSAFEQASLRSEEIPSQSQTQKSLCTIIKETGLDKQLFSLGEPEKGIAHSENLHDWDIHYEGAQQFKNEDLEDDRENETCDEISYQLVAAEDYEGAQRFKNEDLEDDSENETCDEISHQLVGAEDTLLITNTWSELETYDCSKSHFKEASYQNFVSRVEHLSWLISKDQIEKSNPHGNSWQSEIVEGKILKSDLQHPHYFNVNVTPRKSHESPEASSFAKNITDFSRRRMPARPKSENGNCIRRSLENKFEPISYASKGDYFTTREEKKPSVNFSHMPKKTSFFDLSDCISLPKVSAEKIENLRLPKKMCRQCEESWFTEEDV